MADYYEGSGLLTRDVPALTASDISATRWIAAADFYEKHGLLNVETVPADVSAFRWQAMADFYEKNGLLSQVTDPGDISSARWLAMAKFYERNGLLNGDASATEIVSK